MAALNGYIYVAGGDFANGQSTNIVERYSIEHRQWEDVAPMAYERSCFELVELNGFLYAIGDYHIIRNVEKYNPLTNQWQEVAPTNNVHLYFGAAVLNDKIYIAGPTSFEEYDPEENLWIIMTPPGETFYGRRLSVYGGRLYLTGGEALDRRVTRRTQYYSFDQDRWVFARVPLDPPHAYHGVAVVNRRPPAQQ